MIYKHRKFTTLYISKILLNRNSGSIIRDSNTLNCFHIKRVMFRKRIIIIMTSFINIIITTLYSISIITIIIINRRHAIIIINLLIKTWEAKNIIFIKHSIPKLGTNINCSKYILKLVVLIKHRIPKLGPFHIISIITLIINSMDSTNSIAIIIITMSNRSNIIWEGYLSTFASPSFLFLLHVMCGFDPLF